jgi:hypothetical protein
MVMVARGVPLGTALPTALLDLGAVEQPENARNWRIFERVHRGIPTHVEHLSRTSHASREGTDCASG